MEENRRISWSDLFIKIILIVIFVLFTVWLLSLSNKGVTNSLNVLTDNIFAENIDRMKEVGKEYFTTERLPKNVGEIETITLNEMYKKKLILEVKDKNGNACDADDSYISIEKMENEYQMKINLECGEEEDYIIVIMGCYDYCDTDICEKKEETKVIEYQYSKTTGGKWTDYGKWSEWSKVSVTANNYRQIETKKVNEEYIYEDVVTKTLFDEFEIQCPEGYTLNSDKTKCYKVVSTTDTKEPACPDRTSEGYTLVGRTGFTCNYSKITSSTKDPVCPDRTSEGYTLTGRTGFTCNYGKTTSSTKDPVCPDRTSEGYTLTGRTGFTCSYSKKVTTTQQIPVTKPKTCYRQEVVMSCNGTCAPVIQNVPYQCGTTTTYENKIITTTVTDTKNASCPSGYAPSGNTCAKSTSVTDTKNASCPSGYTPSGNTCAKSTTTTDIKNASCPSGYIVSGTKCSKVSSVTKEDKIIKACLNGYKPTSDGTKCYKEFQETVKKTGTRDVIYYRYRVRQYINGTTDYKWSKSNNDKDLLNAGYKLTGKTR